MIEQLQTTKKNTLVIEVIDGFTETDQKLCEKFFNQKMEEGYSHINILVKLDEVKISYSQIKSFMEHIIWVLKNYKNLGHLAIVAHSSVLKTLVPIENVLFKRASEGRLERYFDISQMDEALEFVDLK